MFFCKKILVFLCFFFSFFNLINAIKKGSDDHVSIEPFFIFPASDSDNEIGSFGWFQAGFALENEQTVCVFDSVFPVAGPINNLGTLDLNQDLIFHNTASLQSLGVIKGDSHLLDLGTSVEVFPKHDAVLENVHLILHHDVTLDSKITFSGECYFFGSGSVLSLLGSGSLVIAENSSLYIKELNLHGVKGSNIACVGNDSKLILNNTSMLIEEDYTFSIGSILFSNEVDLFGSNTFLYESSQSSTLDISSVIHLSSGVELFLKKDIETNQQPLIFTDKTSILHIDNAGLIITGSGVQFANGTLKLDNEVIIDIEGTVTSEGLILGDGTEADEMNVLIDSGTTIHTRKGILVYNIFDPNKFISHSETSKIVRYRESNIFMQTALNLSEITMQLLGVPEIALPVSSAVKFEKVVFELPNVSFIIKGRRQSLALNLLGGDDSIFITQGTYNLGTVISGQNNSILGDGAVSGPIFFMNSSAHLKWSLNGPLLANMKLNGGLLTLLQNMYLGQNTLVSNGQVDMNSNSLFFGSKSLVILDDMSFNGNGAVITLNADMSLDATFTLKGSGIIQGNGNEIVIDGNGSIVVDSSSSWHFKNITFKNVKDDNIRCLDDTGNIIFDGVFLQQSGDFVYKKGSLNYYNKNKIQSNDLVNFTYQSRNQGFIHSDTELILENKVTFSYDPIYIPSKELLQFEDSSSVLVLNSSSLHSTFTGIDLLKGTLEVRGNSVISAEVQYLQEDVTVSQDSLDTILNNNYSPIVIDEGVTFGDATADDNDMNIKILNGGELRLAGGSIKYKNNKISSLELVNNISSIYLKNGTLELFKSISFAVGSLKIQKNASIVFQNIDAKLLGTTFSVGS